MFQKYKYCHHLAGLTGKLFLFATAANWKYLPELKALAADGETSVDVNFFML